MRNMWRYSTWTAVFLLGVAMGGCKLYRPYQRPAEVSAAGLYRDSLIGADDSTTIASIGWRDFFADEQLKQLVDRALINNYDLRTALLSIEQTEAQWRQSKAAFAPSVGVSVNEGWSGGTNTSPSPSSSASINVSWQIDLFGQLLQAKRGAQAALLRNEAYARSVQTQLISGVALYYYTLLMLDEQLRISEETLDKWIENVETMELLMKTGITNNAAVVQSQANRYNVETTIPDLKRQIRETENALSILLGQPGQPIARGKLYDQHWEHPLHTGVPGMLLARRPDVQQAEAALMVAFANTGVARSAFYPTLTLTASGSVSPLQAPTELLGAVAAGLTQPLFNRLAISTQFKVAKLEQEKALLAFEKKLLQAGNEVSNALFQYTVLQEKRTARKEQVRSLSRSVYYTQELLKLGNSTYLEVLAAQQSLLTAQLNSTQDAYQELQSVVQLYVALGGGVE